MEMGFLRRANLLVSGFSVLGVAAFAGCRKCVGKESRVALRDGDMNRELYSNFMLLRCIVWAYSYRLYGSTRIPSQLGAKSGIK